MKINLQPHLKLRLKQRNILRNYPEKIFNNPDNKYLDSVTNHLIAVKCLEYNGKIRPMAVSYDIIGNTIQVITIHPISEQEIQNKLKKGRWVKNEED